MPGRPHSNHRTEYRIVLGDDATLLGVVDESRAFEQVHPGAIYLHQGQEYRVSRLDHRQWRPSVRSHGGA